MHVLIWFTVTVYYLLGLVHGERNPYAEALLARPWESVQKYVAVRPGAYMFYWLYYADGTRVRAESKPLIIWLQGGPGLPASGVGNFAEIGPFNMNLEPRNHTWVKGRNVLLIDHPVGTGFSYVTDKSRLVNTDQEMTVDLHETIKAFFKTHKVFRKTPTYIFGQGYGGKICPRLAYYLHTKIQNKCLEMNLKGIGIGSGMVDPKENNLMLVDFLYNAGLIDQNKYLISNTLAKEVNNYIDKGDNALALELYSILPLYLMQEADRRINFTNIKQTHYFTELERFTSTMNKYIKPILSDIVNQKLEWVYFSDVFLDYNNTFLMPSTEFVELLLNKTKLKIAVYNGNLDAITSIAGTSNWVHKLKWEKSEEFYISPRDKIRGHNGFYKKKGQLSLWWVYGSGHWVPEDNPVAMEHILEYVTSDE